MKYTKEQRQRAVKADLYRFCVENGLCETPAPFQQYIRVNDYIIIKKGWSGFYIVDQKTGEPGETGNSIDLLVKYLGYDIVDAIVTLEKYCIE